MAAATFAGGGAIAAAVTGRTGPISAAAIRKAQTRRAKAAMLAAVAAVAAATSRISRANKSFDVMPGTRVRLRRHRAHALCRASTS